ncbi:glycoside hydrolase 43 family protein [Pelobium sp.]|nr:glycoside hydrolase 43 family protein [Pelobium sp.]MDA9555463.1 glycoside hydrolase 43 family protein [Pelobium sp.]
MQSLQKVITQFSIIKIVFITFFCWFEPVSAQQTGSWGDQGNGYYKNPILESNYPDNDVIKVNNTFYMMSSTNQFSPGMIILKSKDLVNWQLSNYIMKAPITFDKAFDMSVKPSLNSRGTWAGSFGYNGKEYYAYWCHNRFGVPNGSYEIRFSKASSIEGPWSVPKEITWPDGSHINTTDPGVFWDLKTSKAWICITINNIVKLYPMSWDGEKMLSDSKGGIVVNKEFEGESNKVYQFDGMYYVMNSHVRKSDMIRMQCISRAKNIEGPWESKLVLGNGNGTNRHPSQGTLLKLNDGSWWFIHQLARGTGEERYMGRPQFLEPVKWVDGWPLIGTDTNGDGVGEVVWENEKPIKGFPITAPTSDDDFSKPSLGLQWMWRYNPLMDKWSLKEHPGFLRLKACKNVLPEDNTESVETTPNFIQQRLMGRYKNVMTAKIDFSGMQNGQEGGLHISSGDNNIIGVKKDDSGKMNLFFKINSKDIFIVKGEAVNQSNVWFRSTVENGLANFFYSLDGKTFTPLGKQVRLLFVGFTPAMIGFYTKNESEKGFIDVDWFKYDYDGPKGKFKH